MSEILLRAWFPSDHRLTPSATINQLIERAAKSKQTLQEELILLQFTGLVDKKGNDVYADFILMDDKGRIFRIYSVPGGFVMKAEYWISDISDLTVADGLIIQALSDPQTIDWIKNECEVVGHIYDKCEGKYLVK